MKKLFLVFGVAMATLFIAFPLVLRAGGNANYSQLPFSGTNFKAYAFAPFAAGRCYLLTPLHNAVVDAYAELEKTYPGRDYMYLEMGWNGGGNFPPHRTHKTGTSADFLTPMRSLKDNSPLNLPVSVTNRWGYDLRLTPQGQYQNMELDAKGLILHLAALEIAANKQGWRIERVILDPPLVTLLKKHPDYGHITSISFMQGKAWFPHDGHYHVDFVRKR